MLEVRYNTLTKELTGWWGSRFGNEEIKLKNRPNEAIVTLDITIPDKPLRAWLLDGQILIPNPEYIEPNIPIDLLTEVEDLKTRLRNLEETRI